MLGREGRPNILLKLIFITPSAQAIPFYHAVGLPEVPWFA